MRSAPFGTQYKRCCVLLLAGRALLPAAPAYAGFIVDDFEIDAVGACNVESWISFASNKDFMAVTSPACVVRLGVPVEIGSKIQRTRAGGEWASNAGFSAKVTLLPLTNSVGIGLSGEADWDLLSGASTGGNINVPVTFDLGHNLRMNVNGGWLYDTPTKVGFAIWGTSVEWSMTPKVALIAEIFGQASPRADPPSITEPRFQTGIRVTPISNLDVSLIYGRNLNGEHANWLTLGFNIGFQAR